LEIQIYLFEFYKRFVKICVLMLKFVFGYCDFGGRYASNIVDHIWRKIGCLTQCRSRLCHVSASKMYRKRGSG